MSKSAGSSVPEKHPVVPQDTLKSWYVLGLLTFSYALAFIDRQMLNLLVDPIRSALQISDTQFSLIQGSAFVFSFLLMAPVFGRLVDVTNRRNILMVGIVAWSIFTALCSQAGTFTELFLARCGVGMSEACVFPVALSLIADFFSPRRAPRALSIFTIGLQLGGGFSLFVSGLVIAYASGLAVMIPALATSQPWQIAFIVVGLPGLLFAMFLLTFREPARAKSIAVVADDRALSLRETLELIWRRRAFYGRIYLGVGSLAIVQFGISSWAPAFLIRTHEMSPANTGYRLGLMSMLIGTVSTLLGPWVAGLLVKRGYVDAHIRTAALSTLVMFLCCLAIPLVNASSVLFVVSGVIFCNSFPIGLLVYTLQSATPSRARGFASSMYTFSAQFLGYAVGPTLIALLTDKVFGDPKMVGYSIQIVTSVASVMMGLLCFTILRPYRLLMGHTGPARSTKLDLPGLTEKG